MRIISGEFRGKKLFEFDYDNIRPTSDNVKEAIFNTISAEIQDSIFLDLFGGTGNVGFEALSRYAKKVYICDVNFNSIKLIKKNNTLFKNMAEVLHLGYEKAIKYFSNNNIKFDIIFLDPPYNTDLGLKAINLIYDERILNEDGIIIYEGHKKASLKVNDNFEIIKEKVYGIKKIYYLVYKDKVWW